MDITDILGGILGGQSRGSGGGTDIFGDILSRAGQASKKGQASPPRQAPPSGPDPATRRSGRTASAAPREDDLDGMARELEDFLGVGRNRGAGAAPQQSPPPPRHQQPSVPPPPPPRESRVPTNQQAETPFSRPAPPSVPGWPPTPPSPQPPANERGQILIRAMVNAAKSDGRITPDEQQKILGQLGNAPGEAVQFLRDELDRPLDVRQFAWSVPIGMEQEVYAMSLLAMTVDSRAEAEYLDQLAHGLRLPAEVRTELDARFGAARRGSL